MTLGLASLLACFAAASAAGVRMAKGPVLTEAPTGATMKLDDLPKQGRETYEQILKGGPFAV